MSVCDNDTQARGQSNQDPACAEIKIKGKAVKVPSACIGDATVLVTGKWLKIAAIMDEELMEDGAVSDPASFVSSVKNARLQADIFTFSQQLPEIVPKYPYYCEWDNRAVIAITTYKAWLGRLTDPVKRAIKKANRVGVVTKAVEFSDAFVEGIQGIYNETPIRQGRAFWHYQKDFKSVRDENSTYLERSAFIGAYFGGELIGFIRMVCVGKVAEIIQILSKVSHYDKRPTNALIAKAVEICEEKGITQLAYCNYTYNDPNSSLTEFKRRNGFEQVLLPKYYIPLTIKGRIALSLKLHRGVKGLIPRRVMRLLLAIRAKFVERMRTTLKADPAAGNPDLAGRGGLV